MGKIIDLEARRSNGSPHLAGEAVCLGCGARWTAVASVGARTLTCHACGLNKGVFAELVERDGPEWRCDCGNGFFRIAPEGIYCPVCGEWRKGF